MKIIDKTFLKKIKNAPENALFVDIETTGLSAERSHIYLFGCANHMEDDKWHLRQWFIEAPGEEKAALSDINEYVKSFDTLVHFNGDRFDLPYLDYRANHHGISSIFLEKGSLDLFKVLKPLKNLLCLPNCRQKSFEEFLDTGRIDLYNGGELIDFYHRYVRTGDESLLRPMLLHNEEDVIGTVNLLNLFPYVKLLHAELDLTGEPSVIERTNCGELILCFTCEDEFPGPVSALLDDIMLKLSGDKIYLKLPVRTQTLKFFYPHASDYYYLPDEDMAVHKSVGILVSPEKRKKATKESCYIKKVIRSYPLMQTDGLNVFREEYGKKPFGEWTPSLLENTAYWKKYIREVLKRI